MFIQAIELEKIISKSNLILVDCRSFQEYAQGHLPGAVNLDLFAFHWFDTSEKGIEKFNDQTKQLLSFLGADFSKKIVFYDNVSGMLAARGVWMLMYFSHPDVLMLDGGIKNWQELNLPIETKLHGFSPSEFSGKINDDLICGYQYIVDNLKDLTIIDARSEDEYNGTTIRAANSGHIPNATNIDWNKNLNPDGTLKDNHLLEEMYNIPKDSEIIVYCQGAYRAANSFLALKKAGFPNVKVYLGSWGEWGNRPGFPVEK